MASPRPRIDASDTFFLGPAPDSEALPLDARDPRNHNLFLLTEGETDLDRLKRGQAMGAPTVSGSMATAVLAYSGIAVKMLVDQRLDAQLHTMFMVDYQPGACANPHDHPFEESITCSKARSTSSRTATVTRSAPAMSSGPVPAVCTRSTRPAARRCAGSRPRRLVSPRHSYRHERDWNYLAELLAVDAGVGAA